MKQYHVYGVGNALVDMEFSVDEGFIQRLEIAKGLMTLVDEKRQIELLAHLGHKNGRWSGGGSAANTIFAVSRFGGRAFYSCKVSDDELGDFYVDDLRSAGVDSNINGPRCEGETGRCLVMVTPDAERSMNTFLGVTENLSVDELEPAAIAQSEYLYMEGYLVTSETGREAAIAARETAERHGVRTALTFSDPAMVRYFKTGLSQMLGDGVDLLFCNEAEALAWADTADLDRALSELRSLARSFAVTLGGRGAVVYDGRELTSIEPHRVRAVDSNGAGDMFAGAFLYAITHGHPYPVAGKLASLAAARVVSDFGPRLPAEEHQRVLDASLN
jgi:sugar/nucleoside kinase (ribokinase family)